MTHRRNGRTCATWWLACLLALPVTVAAQSGGEPAGGQEASLPELQKKVQEAYQAEDYAQAVVNLRRMERHLPFDGKLKYELAAAYALKGDPQRAFHTLVQIQQQGLAYSPRGDERFESITQYQLFDHLSKLLDQNQGPFDKAELAVRARAGLQWPQAIARAGADGDFFLGGLGQGRIVRVGGDGAVATFYEPGEGGPEGVSALAVDAERGHLWAAGTAVRGEGRDLAINMKAAALYRFDLESGELQASFPIADDKPLPHLFNEIAVGPDGRVFAADALSPLVYFLASGADKLEAFIGAPGLSGFHGLAMTPDGRYLFVSDWVTGVYRIETSSRTVSRLAFDPTVNLGGIHSMAFRDGKLFAVQTGTRPERVSRIQLSESLDKAVGMFPLSAAQAEYQQPGLGVLAGDGYYFVANSGWSFSRPPTDTGDTALILKADPELAASRKTPVEMRKATEQDLMDMAPGGKEQPAHEPPGTDDG